MESAKSWLEVAADECQTLVTYSQLLESVEDKERLKEIMGDEFNHALIALFTAAKILDVTVPGDGLETAMDGAKFEGDNDDAD